MVRLRGANAHVEPILAAVSRYLHAGQVPPCPAPDICIDVETGPVLNAPSRRAVWLGTFDNGFTLWRDGALVVLAGGGCQSWLDVGEGRGTVRVSSDPTRMPHRWVGCAVVLESLAILLHRYGLFSMHAAALARDGQGVLLVAASGCGKSTLALRLVASGWDYLSDDTVLLRSTPTHTDVLALRSHFSLDPEADRLFPGLSAARNAALLTEEKWAIDVEALYPERRTATCQPHVLIFPRIVDAAASRLTPVTNAEAFGALLAQSSLASVRLDYTEAHLAALARLVGHTRAYRLDSGRDLLDDPERAHTLLAPLLETTLEKP